MKKSPMKMVDGWINKRMNKRMEVITNKLITEWMDGQTSFIPSGFNQGSRRRWEASVPCAQPWTWYDWRQVLWRGKGEEILRENRGDRTEDEEDYGLANYNKIQVNDIYHKIY